MIRAFREYTVVKNGGRIEIPIDLPDGTEVEVIVLVENKEMNTQNYRLSTEADRDI